MSTRALHDGLQASLEALADGEALDRVLSQHADLAATLRPALETAELLHDGDGEGPPTAAMVRSRARVRAALPSHHPTPFLPRSRIIPRVAGALAAGLIAVAAGLGGLAAASAYALPDSPFYIFKLAGEGLGLQLTLNSRARIALQESQADLRVEEVRRLLLLGRMASVAFKGVLQAQDDTVWHVAGIPVDVPLDTYQTPGIVPGMTVEVHGQTMTSHRFLAEAIHLAGFEFKAAVRSMSGTPGQWTIGDRTVLVTQDTVIDSGIRIGDVVVVSVLLHDTGPLIGREILRLQAVSNMLPAVPTESAPPARTQVPDGYDNEGWSRGQGLGEEEETVQPEEIEQVEEVEEVVAVVEEGKKETRNRNKDSHGGGPGNAP